MASITNKFQIEAALHAEHQAISAGRLKEDNPLDLSEDFRIFCEACRRGDLKICQEKIQTGLNINAKDRFDYTPLILASLCGHYEVVQLLLESGALCERDTFQGERCLYNALNDRIRNLLLQYDYSKSTDPLQPFAAHITSLLTLDHPRTTDITLTSATSVPFRLHKFILAARSPYFAQKLAADPTIQSWNISNNVPGQSFSVAVRYLYLGEVSADLGEGEEEQAILTGISKAATQLGIERLIDHIVESGDRRLARQRRTEELERSRDQFESWFQENVLKNKFEVDTNTADDVRWDRGNPVFADVLLRADYEEEEDDEDIENETGRSTPTLLSPQGIPIENSTTSSPPRKSVLYPAHRAMLIRSDFFQTMFSSSFREAQDTPHLQIVHVGLAPRILEIVLSYLYTESAIFSLREAIDVLFAADLLFIEKLKVKAATIISTLGHGGASVVEAEKARGHKEEVGDLEEVINIFDVVRAGWDTRVQRLEEFGARYIAHRLEKYIDLDDFADLVRDSANRVKERQETDTVELVDDIRYYLSERFRLRFEDVLMDVAEEETAHSSEPPDGAPLISGSDSKPLNGARSATQKSNDAAIASQVATGEVRTLDGELAGDEFDQDAINYQILLGKIDTLLDRLKLDA